MRKYILLFISNQTCLQKGLSDDIYEVFMAMSGRESDLKLLKTLAKNSIKYSALNSHRRLRCQKMWEEKWISFAKGKLVLVVEFHDQFIKQHLLLHFSFMTKVWIRKCNFTK